MIGTTGVQFSVRDLSCAASPSRPGLRSVGPSNSRPSSPSNRAEHRPYPADISPGLADRTLNWQVQRVKYANITFPYQANFAPCSAERMSTQQSPLSIGNPLNLNLGKLWSQKVILVTLTSRQRTFWAPSMHAEL